MYVVYRALVGAVRVSPPLRRPGWPSTPFPYTPMPMYPAMTPLTPAVPLAPMMCAPSPNITVIQPPGLMAPAPITVIQTPSPSHSYAPLPMVAAPPPSSSWNAYAAADVAKGLDEEIENTKAEVDTLHAIYANAGSPARVQIGKDLKAATEKLEKLRKKERMFKGLPRYTDEEDDY
jgi:hypothetical protein